MKEEDLQKQLRSCAGLIKEGYDIDLTWSETLRLKHYLRSIINLQGEKHYSHEDAIHLFMIDSFGLDTFVVAGEISYFDIRKGNIVHQEMGLGFLNRITYSSDKRFRQYCRNHVQQWRDERELI